MKNVKIKPDYYDNFKCIADQCSFTCCREWKIALDEQTYSKWDKLNLMEHVRQCGEGNIIELTSKKDCPYLNEQKLCKLVERFGDDVLSHTCKTFPRQIHEFEGRKEYSLVACCPEIVDVFYKQDSIRFTVDMESMDQDLLFQIRTQMIALLQDKSVSVEKALMMNFFMLLDMNQHNEQLPKKLEEYKQKDALKELSDAIDQMEFVRLDSFDENNELFLDLAENYRKEGIYTEHLEDIALLAESLSETYEEEEMLDKIDQFDAELSKYEPLFRNYLAAELFTNSLMPESDLESMVVMMQWISMEYAIMKHAIFLRWMLDGQEEIAYEQVRKYIVVISRMTGYDEEDIYEYLENSFQSLIWEWGYLALIVGNY